MLGILTAMPEEISALLPLIADARTTDSAGRSFINGHLHSRAVVAVFSRWGKVAAASTATELILSHGITRLALFGIAGSLQSHVRIGDVVIASALVQHDLDASPFFPPTQVPLLGRSAFDTDEAMSADLLTAAQAFLAHDLAHAVTPDLKAQIASTPRTAMRGEVATGDQVITSGSGRNRVLAAVPAAVCTEMEGAAVAQVCHERSIPFACVRTISDSACSNMHHDVVPFIAGIAGTYTAGIVRRWLGVVI